MQDSLSQWKEKAVFFKLEEYAPTEWGDVQKLSADLETKKKANVSEGEIAELTKRLIALYRSAMRSTIPAITKQSTNDCEKKIREAEQALAESLSSSYFQKAKELDLEARNLSVSYTLKLQEWEIEKDASKKELLLDTILDSSKLAITKWNEAIQSAEKAKTLSLSQADQLASSFQDLDADLASAREYSTNDSQLAEIVKFREIIVQATELVQSGKIKEGFLLVEKVRSDSSKLVQEAVAPRVQNEIEISTQKLQSAESYFQKVNSQIEDESFQEEYKNAMDSLGGAKEALNFAKELAKEERFSDSLRHAEEAGRLAYMAEELSIELGKKQPSLPTKKAVKEEVKKEERVTEIDIDHPMLEDGIDEKTESEKEISQPIPPKKTYKVSKKRPRETLSRIAKSQYGKSSYWKKIYKANKNKIKNPNLIYPRQIFILP